MKKQIKKNIEAIDVYIETLHVKLINVKTMDEHKETIERMEKLTELRCKLSESLVNSSHAKEIISGAIGIAGMLLVLKHEQANIITTKAFNMALNKFKG